MKEKIEKALELHEGAIGRLLEVETLVGKNNPISHSLAKYLPALRKLAAE